MPFHLFTGRYATSALMLDTAQNREAAARAVIEAGGGKLHNMFFMFGENDLMVLAEAPDDVAMASIALAVGSSGALSGGATTKLMPARRR